jgi:hypothetical protein
MPRIGPLNSRVLVVESELGLMSFHPDGIPDNQYFQNHTNETLNEHFGIAIPKMVTFIKAYAIEFDCTVDIELAALECL